MKRQTKHVSGRMILLLAAILFGPAARAETLQLSPDDDWFAVLNGEGLPPGTVVELTAGTYSNPRRLSIGHAGTKEAPVVIRAKAGHRVVFRRPDARQNTINVEGSQYLTLEGIEITGGAAAVRIHRGHGRMPRNLALVRLHIHHVGGVAVTCNEPGTTYREMLFRENHIHHTAGHGEGFYLGSNNDASGKTTAVFRDSVIERNHIHHLKGDHVTQGDGIEIKDGSFNNIVRDNRIHDTNYPGIIVYGTDGQAPNRIERNAIWNTADHGIQAAADAVIQNNLIFNTRHDGIHSRDHQSAHVSGLRIVNNTIVNVNGHGIRINTPDGSGKNILIANNAIFTASPLRAPTHPKLHATNNFLGTKPSGLLENHFPRRGSPLIGAAKKDFLPADDFDGRSRDGSNDIGAYRFSTDGPRTRLEDYFFEADRK